LQNLSFCAQGLSSVDPLMPRHIAPWTPVIRGRDAIFPLMQFGQIKVIVTA
jgi:hypothetical protein